MTKHFCDKCGDEIPHGVGTILQFLALVDSRRLRNYHVCNECSPQIVEFIGERFIKKVE